MGKVKGSIRAGLIAGLAWVFVLGLPVSAKASWFLVHGSGASIQDADDAAVVQSYGRKGYGLEIKLGLGTSTWVHFAVPTPFDPTGLKARYAARYVQVRVNMLNTFCQCSGISEIDVYNGETLIRAFTTGWNTSGWQTITLDLGKVYYFSKGMGISVKIDTGFNGGYDSFIFTNAGGNFVK